MSPPAGQALGAGVSERDLAATWKQSPGPRPEDTSGLLPVTGPRPRPSPCPPGKGAAWRRTSERDGYGVGAEPALRWAEGGRGSLCHRRGGGPPASFHRAPLWGQAPCHRPGLCRNLHVRVSYPPPASAVTPLLLQAR